MRPPPEDQGSSVAKAHSLKGRPALTAAAVEPTTINLNCASRKAQWLWAIGRPLLYALASA
jgi:hypothetical protein